jgi:gluconolactonase
MLTLVSAALLATPEPRLRVRRPPRPGAQVEKLAEGFSFTEGPTADAAGNVFFTDQPNDRILKWSVDGKLTTFLQPAGRSNGMYFDRDGSLIACADEKNELWSIAKDGKARVIWKEHEKKKLNGPTTSGSTPAAASTSPIPFYKRPWWTHDAPPQGGQHVYRLSADRKKIKRVTSDLEQPNGIIGSPDGKTLYVADIKAGKTYAYDIQKNGMLAGKRLHAALGSDGMTLDEEGNLYLTRQGRARLRQDGQGDPGLRHPRGLDGERELRRRRPPHAVHHRQQGPLRRPSPRQGRERREIAGVDSTGTEPSMAKKKMGRRQVPGHCGQGGGGLVRRRRLSRHRPVLRVRGRLSRQPYQRRRHRHRPHLPRP